jgi:hypothetical protein
LAGLVGDGRIGLDEAQEMARDLTCTLARKAYRL